MFASVRPLVWTVPALALALTAPATAQGDHDLPPFRFKEVTAGRGILPLTTTTGMGSGVNAVDYDLDGDIDVFAVSAGPDQLYRSNGRTFEEVAAEVGLADTTMNRCAIWFDADGDHDLDLVTGNDAGPIPTSYQFHRQLLPDRFVNQTHAAGMYIPEQFIPGLPGTQSAVRGGFSAGDIDLDGDLDLYACSWKARPRMFENTGNAVFADISGPSGIWNIATDRMTQFQPMMVDLSRDGYPDIYVAVDYKENVYLVNQQNNTFVDAALGSGLDNLMNDMGMSIVDYDEDGDFDIYTTNIDAHAGWNALFRNDSTGGVPLFSEVATETGCQGGYWGWGTSFVDADLDGHVDILATNGWKNDSTLGDWTIDPSRFFRHRGFDGRDGEFLGFEELSAEVGFDDTYWGSGLAAFDLDRDGDIDAIQVTMTDGLRLLENEHTGFTADGQARNYLVVKPRMAGGNHLAIGAVVRIKIGDRQQTRLISAGSSFYSQEPAEAHFGLGTATVVDEVVVQFPGGVVKTRTEVPANQVLRIDG